LSLGFVGIVARTRDVASRLIAGQRPAVPVGGTPGMTGLF
jgi:hypothetical protein